MVGANHICTIQGLNVNATWIVRLLAWSTKHLPASVGFHSFWKSIHLSNSTINWLGIFFSWMPLYQYSRNSPALWLGCCLLLPCIVVGLLPLASWSRDSPFAMIERLPCCNVRLCGGIHDAFIIVCCCSVGKWVKLGSGLGCSCGLVREHCHHRLMHFPSYDQVIAHAAFTSAS